MSAGCCSLPPSQHPTIGLSFCISEHAVCNRFLQDFECVSPRSSSFPHLHCQFAHVICKKEYFLHLISALSLPRSLVMLGGWWSSHRRPNMPRPRFSRWGGAVFTVPSYVILLVFMAFFSACMSRTLPRVDNSCSTCTGSATIT